VTLQRGATSTESARLRERSGTPRTPPPGHRSPARQPPPDRTPHRRTPRSPPSTPTRRASGRPTGSRRWSGMTSSSASPTLRFVRLNRAVAVGEADGAPAGLRPRATSTHMFRAPSGRRVPPPKRTAISNSLPASRPTPPRDAPNLAERRPSDAPSSATQPAPATAQMTSALGDGPLDAVRALTIDAPTPTRPKLCRRQAAQGHAV
jgi:hypothetical protein